MEIAKTVVAYSPNLIGLILPPFIVYLNKDVKDDRSRFFVTLFACMIIAVLLHLDTIIANYSLGSAVMVIKAMSYIFVESQVVYKLYFKNSVMHTVIMNKIEASKEDKLLPEIPDHTDI